MIEFFGNLCYWLSNGGVKMAWIYTQLKWEYHPEIFGEMLVWLLIVVCAIYLISMFKHAFSKQ